MDYHQSLAANHVFSLMTEDDYGRLSPLMERTTLERDFVLNEVGADVNSVYFPVGAVLSTVTLMEDGHGVGTSTIGHDNAYGLLNTLGAPHEENMAICQIAGGCYHLSISRLRQAARESPSLTTLLIRHIQANVAQTRQSVACNAVHSLEARLCRWLLMSHDRAGPGPLPLTQEFLGYMLGVHRTTVTLAAHALQSAGLIYYVRGLIEILDRQRLEESACECYAASIAQHARFFEGFPRLR